MIETFVACHINGPRPQLDYLTPIQTGAIFKQHWDGFLHDDEGDNISLKNSYFGEHTGLYWVWKNTTAEEVGWAHYRRYISTMLFPGNQYQINAQLEAAQTILNLDRGGIIFNYELAFADIILPQRLAMAGSISAQYATYHRPSDWNTMIKALHEFYPNEAHEAQQYFDTTSTLHAFCMFMTKRHHFNAFCEWLFPFLFFIEDRITVPEDIYQRRVFSYLSERLFNWWVASRGLKTTYRPIIHVE